MKRLGLLAAGLLLSVSMVCAETDYVASGYDYLATGDLQRAERMFKGAIKINVDNEAAWEGLKKVHAAMAAAKKGGKAAPAKRRPVGDDAGQAEAPAAEEEGPSSSEVEAINKKLLNKYLTGRGGESSEESKSSDERGAKGKRKPKKPDGEDSEEASSEAPAPAVAEKIDETIDKDLLKSGKKAGDEFNKLRNFATSQWKRESGGATQFIATYYSPALYKLLVTKLGAQKNWSVAETQKKFKRLMTDNSGVLEFYVKLINTTRKPKAAVPVGDITDRTTLEDDNGNSYKPMRQKAPSNPKLLDEDSYTVWFPKYDADGNSILDKAKEKLFLVINDQEHEPATIRIAFTKKQFQNKASGSKDDKSWWQKLF